jgi:tetratricopeptide (TPR) repeat protein
VTREPATGTFTLRSTQDLLGLSRTVIAGLIDAGFVTPARGPRNEYRFTFQDMVLLRTAVDLRTAKVPPRKILSSLRRLRDALPAELPMTGLRISAVGAEVTVRDGKSRWQPDSGQLVMDFELAPEGASVAFLQRKKAHSEPTSEDPAGLFRRGEALEASDTAAAEAAYRRTLELDPDFAEAYVNLGALLCEAGRCREAVALLDQAIRRRPDNALLHFNRAIALEDQQRASDAIASYEACLRLDPELADAHFNAARLYEQTGDGKRAVRHLSAYRRLRG